MLFHMGVLVSVQALMGIKVSLVDPHGVLNNLDEDAVDHVAGQWSLALLTLFLLACKLAAKNHSCFSLNTMKMKF